MFLKNEEEMILLLQLIFWKGLEGALVAENALTSYFKVI